MLSLFQPEKAASAPVSAVVDATSTAFYSIVKDSVFGALLTIAVVGIIWLIRRLISIQDLRVADQVRANELMERTREKTAALMEKMTKASSEVNSALEKMSDAQADQARSIGELRMVLQQLQMTMDSIIRDAVRRRDVSVPPVAQRTSSSSLHTRPERRENPGGYAISEPGKGERGRR